MKILKFYAEWSGPCQTYAPIFESVTKGANVEVVNVDIDKGKECTDYYIFKRRR